MIWTSVTGRGVHRSPWERRAANQTRIWTAHSLGRVSALNLLSSVDTYCAFPYGVLSSVVVRAVRVRARLAACGYMPRSAATVCLPTKVLRSSGLRSWTARAQAFVEASLCVATFTRRVWSCVVECSGLLGQALGIAIFWRIRAFQVPPQGYWASWDCSSMIAAGLR